MAITTGDGLIAALGASVSYSWVKNAIANTTAGAIHSYWTFNGSPIAGNAPTTATTCNSSTTGAIPFTNPTPPSLTYLGYFASMSVSSGNGVGMVMFDRLSHMGGLSGTNTGSQAVNLSIPASRQILADSTNAEWFVECYTDLGSSGQTLTVTYVNTASATNTVAVSIPASMRAGRLMKIVPTVAGDVIQSITSCQLGGSTGTVGNFGLTCARKLTQSGTVGSADVDIQDFISCGAPIIPDNACLWLVSIGGGSIQKGYIKLLQG